jgi:hypothetical protein
VDNLTAQATSFRALPDEALLAMPTQPLRGRRRHAASASSPRAIALRRFVVMAARSRAADGAGGRFTRVRGEWADGAMVLCWRCSLLFA